MLVHSCEATVIAGLDDDRCALGAIVDPHRLNIAGEVEALRDGRRTYLLDGRHQLHRRDRWTIPGRPAGDVHHVLAEHRCGQPLPATWLAPRTAAPATRPTAEEIPW